MAEWGRKEYSKKWPSRTPVWTWTAVLGSLVFFAGMLTLQYERSWSAAERLYLTDYLKSGARGKASATAASKYTLLEAVVGKGQRLVIGDEIEEVPAMDGRPGYRLTEQGVRDGIARLTWVTANFNDRGLHRVMGEAVYANVGSWEFYEKPFWASLAFFVLALFVAVPKDRARRMLYKHGRRLRGPELVTTSEFNEKLGKSNMLRVQLPDGVAFINEEQTWWDKTFHKDLSRWARVPREREAMHFLIVGDSGTGKSAAIRQLLSQVWERGEAAIVYDPAMEYLRHFYNEARGDVILNPMNEVPCWVSATSGRVRSGGDFPEGLVSRTALPIGVVRGQIGRGAELRGNPHPRALRFGYFPPAVGRRRGRHMRVPNASMEALAAIQAVATFRDRGKAAAALGIGVSALDKRLKSISQLLGTDVIRFVGEGVELTEAAEIYRRDAERALDAAVLAEERAKSHLVLQERQLVVGHSTYLAPKILKMILNLALPDDEPVSIDHRAGLTADIAERVAAGTLHAAFGFLPIDIPGLTARAFFEDPIMVCLPSGHRLAVHRTVRPEELASESIITVGREPVPALHEEAASYFAEFGIELNVVEDAFAPVEALTLVEQGRGLCFLASSSITERRGIAVKALATKGLTRKSGVFVRSDQQHPLVLRLVEEAVRLSRELSGEKK